MSSWVGSHGDPFWREEFPLTVAWAFGPMRIASRFRASHRARGATVTGPQLCVKVVVRSALCLVADSSS